MKKNNKGFTLIELLAVIVILAIIALIAVPIVLNLIERARKGSYQDSAYSLRKAADNYYLSYLLDVPTGLTADVVFTCDGKDCKTTCAEGVTGCKEVSLELDGTVPTAGTVTIKPNGTKEYAGITYGSYICTNSADGSTDGDIGDTGSIVCASK